jgi:murein DD-endopeptidase MepM/ murein hydrolase activator NlpD
MLISAALIALSASLAWLPVPSAPPFQVTATLGKTFTQSDPPPTLEVGWPVAGFVHRLPEIPYPNWNSGHRGIDITMPYGPNVYSPVSGIVTWVGTINNQSGITVQAHDEDGLKHSLFPISTFLLEGDAVIKGQLLGEVTDDISEHCGFIRCIHWGVRDGDRYLDPRWLLEPLIFELP